MSDNGILRQVPGDYIAQALEVLPPPASAPEEKMEVVIEAGHLGPVKIFAERHQARHHKHSHYFWVAYRAEFATPT